MSSDKCLSEYIQISHYFYIRYLSRYSGLTQKVLFETLFLRYIYYDEIDTEILI